MVTSEHHVEGLPVVTLRAEDHRPSFNSNTHRVIIKEETEHAFIGWPEHWIYDNYERQFKQAGLSAIGLPLEYPKFAWEVSNG